MSLGKGRVLQDTGQSLANHVNSQGFAGNVLDISHPKIRVFQSHVGIFTMFQLLFSEIA